MTAAELLIALVVLFGLFWLLRPLRLRVTAAVAKRLGRPKEGRVIQGEFRSIDSKTRDKD